MPELTDEQKAILAEQEKARLERKAKNEEKMSHDCDSLVTDAVFLAERNATDALTDSLFTRLTDAKVGGGLLAFRAFQSTAIAAINRARVTLGLGKGTKGEGDVADFDLVTAARESRKTLDAGDAKTAPAKK